MGVVRFLSVHCREQVFVSFFLFLDPRYVQFIVRLEVRKESFYLAKRQRLWWRGECMKKQIRIVFLLIVLMISSHGQAEIAKYFSLTFRAPTRAELDTQLAEVLPALRDGTNERLRREFYSEGCWPIRANKIEVWTPRINLIYREIRRKLVRQHKAVVRVLHKKCMSN